MPSIRIKQADPERPFMWYNKYVGYTFPIVGDLNTGIPRQWEVDISSVDLPYATAYVPECDAELIWPESAHA